MEHIDNEQNKKLATSSSDSITTDYVCLDGERVPCSFRCNKKLWKSFVSFSKRNYGSVCHILEPILLTIIQQRVILSNTLRPIKIENLVVEREVKRVRRYAVEEKTEITVEVRNCVACGRSAYVVVMRADKSQACLCRVHFAAEKPGLLNWRRLNE
jgi:hypothetical protein